MTQEFVTLPREVVEQALEALFMYKPMATGVTFQHGLEAMQALRAALDQPQADQPAMTPIAQRKLEDLMVSGYTISGYSIYHEQKHQHGFVTGAGLVGWWKPEGMEYPQPKGEQEPVAWYDGRKFYGNKAAASMNMANMSVLSPVYLHQQPKREPLTDEAVLGVAKSIEIQFDSERLNEQIDDILAFARAIEAAHNIK